MLNLNRNYSIYASSQIKGGTVATMNATINSNDFSFANITRTINDYSTYNLNKEEIDKDIADFEKIVEEEIIQHGEREAITLIKE